MVVAGAAANVARNCGDDRGREDGRDGGRDGGQGGNVRVCGGGGNRAGRAVVACLRQLYGPTASCRQLCAFLGLEWGWGGAVAVVPGGPLPAGALCAPSAPCVTGGGAWEGWSADSVRACARGDLSTPRIG